MILVEARASAVGCDSSVSSIGDIVLVSSIGDMRIRTSKDLGIHFRERRRALGLSQADVAKRVGTSRQWVVDLERGKPRLEIALVLRAAEALDLVPRFDAAVAPSRAAPGSLGIVPIDLDAVIERARRTS